MAVVIAVDSMSLDVKVSLSTRKTDTATTPPLTGPAFTPAFSKNVGLSSSFVLRDGAIFVGTIPISTFVDLNLATVKNWWQEFMLTQPVTGASKIKMLALSNDSPAGTDADIDVGPAAAAGFVGPLKGTTPKITVGVGAPPMIWSRPAGFADNLTTNNILRLTNLSAATIAVYRVLVGGSDT